MLKPIEESIHILKQLNYKIQHSINTVIEKSLEYKIDELTSQSLFYYTMDLGLILSVSYLNELNNYFFKALKIEMGEEYSKKFMKVLNIPKKQIGVRFPDLKEFRNNYLAHNMRVDQQKFKSVVLSGDLRRYKVPQNPHDYIFLSNCINQIDITINYFFPDAFTIADLYGHDAIKNVPLLNPQFVSVEELDIERHKISNLMQAKVDDLGLN